MAELGEAMHGAVVGELLRKLITTTKKAHRCKENCKSLLVTLDLLSLPLNDVASFATTGNVSCQEWFKSVNDLLNDAKTIAEACLLKKWTDRINYMQRAKLSSKIIAIDNQIQKKVAECHLLTYGIVLGMENLIMEQQSTIRSMVPNVPNSNVQDIPSMRVPFVANPFERLKDKIINGRNVMDEPTTIGLKGRAGCGKTLLAKMINNDEDIQRKYDGGGILWITIGRNATIPSLYLTMAELHVGDVYKHVYSHRNLEDQRGYLIHEFQKKKVLLILDDVWDYYPSNDHAMIEWLDVAKGPGSTTLITTWEVPILKCVKCVDIMDVQSLSKVDSWELFCMHAFARKKPPSSLIEDLAKGICEQCDGLPLAIKVIGSAMWEKIAEQEWRNTLNYLEGTTTQPHSKFVEKEVERKLYNHLQYSYDALDDNSKKCFLHFAAFPEDDEISTNHLCDIWHVLQLFGPSNAQKTRDIGIPILVDLADRSLIDMSSNGDHVQIHDVLRDLANHILSKAKPDEWASQCFFQVGKVFETFPVIGKDVKIVSLIGYTFHELPNNLELPLLQVCLLSKIVHAKDFERLVIPQGFFSSMKHLQFLNMCDSIGVEGHLLNFEGLPSLTHLYLSGCLSLIQLPEGIKELKSLTHLDLSGCLSLIQLLEGIKELKSLTHLDLRWRSSLTQLPEGIKELKSLMHMDLSYCSSLTQLPEGIKELKSLMLFKLSWCKSLTQLPDEGIKELKSLTHLDLSWCSSLTQLPEGIKELKSLTHLDWYGWSSFTQLPKVSKI